VKIFIRALHFDGWAWRVAGGGVSSVCQSDFFTVAVKKLPKFKKILYIYAWNKSPAMPYLGGFHLNEPSLPFTKPPLFDYFQVLRLI
jgi:hypothetical protein